MAVNRFEFGDKHYPALLAEIVNPPQQIFYRGQINFGHPTVAIVGTRRPTSYGRAVTEQLAEDLASCGVVIISGLALGIDSIAHQAALNAGGQTAAVLANGLDQIYPSSNRTLSQSILKHGGGLISEHPDGTPPLRHHFPARNRIIAGLSLAVIVSEAAAHSGALITANFALEQNRLVMAIPGNINQPQSVGPNNLIKSGAAAVTEAKDVLLALDLEVSNLKAKLIKPASQDEATILDLLSRGVTESEALIEISGFAASKFNHVITLMEISGKVRSLGGGKWISN